LEQSVTSVNGCDFLSTTSRCLLPLMSTGTKVLRKIKKRLNDEESTITSRSGGKSKSKLRYQRRTVGQSFLVSNPFWGTRPDICYCQTVPGFLMWGALSDEKTGPLLLVLASAVILGSKSRGTHYHTLLSQIRENSGPHKSHKKGKDIPVTGRGGP
jgi:hypothetical protein